MWGTRPLRYTALLGFHALCPNPEMSLLPAQLLSFLLHVGSLKRTPRAGWVRKGIPQPESVAGHMYRMSVMALTIPSEHPIDVSKAVSIAIVHDLAEAIVGDITPMDGIPKNVKQQMELDAMVELTSLLPVEQGKLVMNLFLEYEAGETIEARFVKDLDKLDMVVQAHEYHKEYSNIDLSEFFDSVRGKLRDSNLQKISEEIPEMSQ